MNDTILDVHELFKSYGSRNVVNGLSFKVKKGEIVGLLGPNGAGKTSAFYMVMGLIKPNAGSITFKNQNITNLPVHERALMGMGYLAQEPSIFRSLSVEDNIMCILETLPISAEERRKRLSSLLEELKLTALAKKCAATLSGGERRRLEITRALVSDPSLLLLDEPFANIDPISISDVQAMIRLLAAKGISVLITDHNAREIFSIVDTSYLVSAGQLMLSGTVDEIMANQQARNTYLGENFRL